MASNILKPIGFVLILGAVAAGAYYFGKSSGAEKPQASGAKSDAQPSPPPGMVEQAKDWVMGTPASGTETPAQPPVEPAGTSPSTAKPAVSRPAVKQPVARPAAKPPAAPVLATVGDAVPTRVTALSGNLVLTRAKAKVYLLGVKTPDSGTDAVHAREALEKLLGDGSVKIQLTPDRAAAVVWKDGQRINESMVRLGWSRSEMYPVAEAEAKRNRDGLWSPEGWMGP